MTAPESTTALNEFALTRDETFCCTVAVLVLLMLLLYTEDVDELLKLLLLLLTVLFNDDTTTELFDVDADASIEAAAIEVAAAAFRVTIPSTCTDKIPNERKASGFFSANTRSR